MVYMYLIFFIQSIIDWHLSLFCETDIALISELHNSKDMESTQKPINDRLDKENVVHIHHGILCSHKKNKIMYFAGTWMELEAIILSKLMQEQKTKHHTFSLISGS